MSKQLTNEQEKELQEISQRTTKGALLVSQFSQVFSSNTHLGENSLLMISDTTGGASITAPTLNSPWLGLTVGTASGDKARYRSRNFMRYQAYRTHRVSFAASFATPQAGMVQRAGICDDNDGLFWKFDETGIAVVHRTATSGAPVDDVVYRDDWNEDKLYGYQVSGLESGTDFRFDRGITFGIDYNWYGTQCAHFWIGYGSSIVYTHEFIFTGQNDGLPYMRNAMLPLCFEIENTAGVASPATMRVGTCSLAVGDDTGKDGSLQFAVSNDTTAVSATSTTVWQDVLAVRPKATINSIQNRGTLRLNNWKVLAESNSIEYRVIENVTYTGGTWNSVNADSIAEYSVSPGTQAGTPRVIEVDYLYSGRTTGNNSQDDSVDANIRITNRTSDLAQITYVLQARKLSTTNADVYATLTWSEEY